MKYIIFDLDETLGHFVQLGIFYEVLKEYFEKYERKKIDIDFLDKLFELYPSYFRPHLFQIMKYIQKNREKNVKVILFTNNQGPKIWAQQIVYYIERKIGEKLFDKIIGAFTVNNIVNEPLRTSNHKKISDLEKILNLNRSDKILFFDDQNHEKMIDHKVKYIHMEKYVYHYEYYYMIEKMYKNHRKLISNKEQFIMYMNEHLMRFYFPIQKTSISKTDNEYSKKMMKTIMRFLRKSKTRKALISPRKNLNKTKKHKK